MKIFEPKLTPFTDDKLSN